jgi:hypothetical protein
LRMCAANPAHSPASRARKVVAITPNHAGTGKKKKGHESEETKQERTLWLPL